MALPLTYLTNKEKPNTIEWGEPQERAYTSLKYAVTSRPVLHLPDHDKPYTLRVDASEVGVGVVLLQVPDGKLFPVGYESKELTGAERKHSSIERESLAVVWAVKKYLCYLYGREFTIQTNHQPCHLTGAHQHLPSTIFPICWR